MKQQKGRFQKSVPLFFDISPPPHSAVVKTLLREILREPLQPLTFDEVRKLKRQKRGRKRVYLTTKDADLINFFFFSPVNMQYAVFKKLNEKLQEVLP